VVVAINPFADLPIYTQAYIDKYRGRSAFDPKLQPHMYAPLLISFSLYACLSIYILHYAEMVVLKFEKYG
jgi:myosin heavy subunit